VSETTRLWIVHGYADMKQTAINGCLEADVTSLKAQKSTFLAKAIKAEASMGPLDTQF